MPIDFQPLQASIKPETSPTAPVSNGIDFQPIEKAPINQVGPSIAERPSSIVEAASKVPGLQKFADMIEPVTGRIVAAGAAAKQSFLDSAKDTASLVSNLLDMTTSKDSIVGKLNTKAKEAGSKVYDTFSNSPIENQAAGEHPLLYGAVGGPGYVLGLGWLQSPVTNLLNKGVIRGLQKVAPGVAASPVVSGAISNAITGTGMGAASDTENPLRGAVTGFGLGLGFGAAGGAIGNRAKRAGDIIDFEIDNLVKAGVDPTSDAGFSRIVKSLKDNGVDMEKIGTQTIITNKIGDLIKKAGPLKDIESAPADVLSTLAQKRYGQVTEEVKALKQPLVDAKQVFSTPSYTQALDDRALPILSKKLKDAVPKIPENATFDQMWNARQALDGIIHTARARATKDVTYKISLPGLTQARKALTQDMANAADSLGMRDQWTQINRIYKQQIVPFQFFKTASGKLKTEDDVFDAMKTINTLLNPKQSPNFKALNNVAKALGPEGQDLVGQAMLQNMVLGAKNDKGLIDPKTFFTNLKKTNKSGLDVKLWGPKTRQAAEGIRQVLDGADEALKTGQIQVPQAQGFISKFYDGVVKSRAGIELMKLLGSSKVPQTKARAIINNLITGLAVTGQTRTDEQAPSE